ncbi:MAG: LysE family transporter [Deltaproteobacteria bacterium]|jgi:threonine/homoserine/homoserine lactone efflux protein|nr:LysE family transporter [Deltaproteobacteria bacterium]MBW2536283.1 LysE family transporter [Deltaproteobacteria bacterium]
MLTALLVGFALGFIGSMPVAGPIAALVFARGAEGRFRSGSFIALGAALGESLYVFGVFYGFSEVLTRYGWIVPVSRAAAAIILTVLGVVFLRAKQAEPESSDASAERAWPSFLLGVTLTALNPTLLATWTAAVTTLYSADVLTFSGANAPPFAFGACVGIASWFLLLLALIRRFRERLTLRTLARVVRVVGVFLLGLAAWFVFRLVEYFVQSAS